jgi:hypothetical protein
MTKSAVDASMGRFITHIAAETLKASSGPSHSLTQQAVDWENVLVRIVVIESFFIFELVLIV